MTILAITDEYWTFNLWAETLAECVTRFSYYKFFLLSKSAGIRKFSQLGIFNLRFFIQIAERNFDRNFYSKLRLRGNILIGAGVELGS